MSRYDAPSEGKALLIAYWSVLGINGIKILQKKKSILRADATSKDYENIVAAQNQALLELSRTVAAEIKKLH